MRWNPFRRRRRIETETNLVWGQRSPYAGQEPELKDPVLSEPPTGYSDDFWHDLGVEPPTTKDPVPEPDRDSE